MGGVRFIVESRRREIERWGLTACYSGRGVWAMAGLLGCVEALSGMKEKGGGEEMETGEERETYREAKWKGCRLQKMAVCERACGCTLPRSGRLYCMGAKD